MQLSKNTIEALKNLALINDSILIKPTDGEGTTLRSMSPESNLVGIFKVEEDFKDELPIYNLNQFLAALTSVENPVLDVKDNHVIIKSGRYSTKIYFADKAMIKTAREGGSLPKPDVSFKIANDDLQQVLKMASALRLDNILVIAGDGKIRVVATDAKNDTSSSFELIVDDSYQGKDYTFHIKKELLKFIPSDYIVNIAAEKLAEFTTEDGNRTYYVALEMPKK